VVDLNLSESTSERHADRVRKFLEVVKKDPRAVSKTELREYLKSIKTVWKASTYKNVLASLKRFYRDYLERIDLVESFTFPPRSYSPIRVPSKKEINDFYQGLESTRDKALFLVYASSGLRNSEVVNLEMCDIDFKKRMMMPQKKENKSKHVWISFYNEETEKVLNEHLVSLDESNSRLFTITREHVARIFRKTSNNTGVKISPQILRDWFCCEMGRLGVADRYVDAFCGRVPRSVLARHYTDYSPERLKEIYDKAKLKVLL
jgi:site-specific recombinase XerD